MMHVYACRGDVLRSVHTEPAAALPEDVVWIDMLNPTKDEERTVEHAFGIDIPTREETREIEASSRIYRTNDALYMNLNVVARAEEGAPEVSSITFVLTGGKLVTIRYSNPMPFRTFLAQGAQQTGQCADGLAICAGLMDAIVDRLADILESVGAEIDGISKQIFATGRAGRLQRDFAALLSRIGHNEDLASKARDSLTSVARATAHLTQATKVQGNKALKQRFEQTHEDIVSLNDYISFMSNKLSFVLDATLGMIGIEQNQIVKVFTVFMVVTTPPIVIAGIYGMNFKVMPELDFPWGYPLALLVMLASAILPYLWIKRRGWL